MSRKTVRAAVAAWFAPPAVEWLTTCHRAEPKVIKGPEFFAAPGDGSGAVSFVHIEGEGEYRIALGGPDSGKKLVRYSVALVVTFRSTKQDSEEAMDDYDDMIESLKRRLRSDRQLGTANSLYPIFQAGEGSPDIQIASELPHMVNQQMEIGAAVRFQVEETITA